MIQGTSESEQKNNRIWLISLAQLAAGIGTDNERPSGQVVMLHAATMIKM